MVDTIDVFMVQDLHGWVANASSGLIVLSGLLMRRSHVFARRLARVTPHAHRLLLPPSSSYQEARLCFMNSQYLQNVWPNCKLLSKIVLGC